MQIKILQIYYKYIPKKDKLLTNNTAILVQLHQWIITNIVEETKKLKNLSFYRKK